MNYELAKELKDAGFPQGTKVISNAKKCENPNCLKGHDAFCHSAYPPTLEELIEACGYKFYSLVYAMDNDWRCFSERDGDYVNTADGKTPTEAVARLWLALNQQRVLSKKGKQI